MKELTWRDWPMVGAQQMPADVFEDSLLSLTTLGAGVQAQGGSQA